MFASVYDNTYVGVVPDTEVATDHQSGQSGNLSPARYLTTSQDKHLDDNKGKRKMSFRKSRKNKPFTTVYNEVAQHPEMSMEARGLLLFMLSLPDDWVFHQTWLQSKCPKWGREKVSKIIKELQGFGYLHRTPKRSDDGRKLAGWEWEVLAESSLQPEVRETRNSDKRRINTVKNSKSELRVSSDSENLSVGKPTTTNKTSFNKENSSSSKRDQIAPTDPEFSFTEAFAVVLGLVSKQLNITEVPEAILEAIWLDYQTTAKKPGYGNAVTFVINGIQQHIGSLQRSMRNGQARDEVSEATIKTLKAQAKSKTKKAIQIEQETGSGKTLEDKMDRSWDDDSNLLS